MSETFKFYPLVRIYKYRVSELCNIVVLGLLAAGFSVLAEAGASWGFFLLLCWGFGAATLPFTWRPKPAGEEWNKNTALAVGLLLAETGAGFLALALAGTPWWSYLIFVAGDAALMSLMWLHLSAARRVEVFFTFGFGYLYLVQIIILSIYRFIQLVQDPYKLWHLAPELRRRADLVIDEDAYGQQYYTEREFHVRAVGAHCTIKERHSSPVYKLIGWLAKEGAQVLITFDEGYGLRPQQRRYLEHNYGRVNAWWGGRATGLSDEDFVYVEIPFMMMRGRYHLTETEARKLVETIETAEQFRGTRKTIQTEPD